MSLLKDEELDKAVLISAVFLRITPQTYPKSPSL